MTLTMKQREWDNTFTPEEVMESARLCGTTHAYHDFRQDTPDKNMADEWLMAYSRNTVAWEYDVPNPMEVWEDTYEPPLWGLADLDKVRMWARSYNYHYLLTTATLMNELLRDNA